MPKIRNIKAEFWTDEKIVELTPWARLLFIGMWNFADDNGILEEKPKQLKMRIFPADNIDILPLLSELKILGLIYSYKIESQNLIIIPNFAKHQYINSTKKTESFPIPDKSQTFLIIPRKNC